MQYRKFGRTEDHCPQGIAIRTELKHVKAAFEDAT
jgi:predicted aldo/keto reductase-like oxidoreductase